MSAAACGAAISATATVALGKFQWDRSIAKMVARLLFNLPEPSPQQFRLYDIATLPAPVRQYFCFALQPGQAVIQHARIEQVGQFRMGGIDSKWSPFTAVQHITGGLRGFVWAANIHAAPFISVRVSDSYIRGLATMRARVASLIPILNLSGTRELAAGALHRYLAEAVWMPTALLPSQGVEWEPIDERTARATLTDHGISVSLEFEFGESGEIVRSYTPDRGRAVNGAWVPTPSACHYSEYVSVGEMMVPRQGEAQWLLPEGALPYCRLNLSHIEYTRPMLRQLAAETRTLRGMEELLHIARLEGEREKYCRPCEPTSHLQHRQHKEPSVV
jgi:hypothetical protein